MTWKKGQSGNPNGRPKDGQSWAGMLEKIGDEMTKDKGMSKKEAICRILYKEASEGNSWAVKELIDRIEGRPRQQTDMDITSGGESITNVTREIIDNC